MERVFRKLFLGLHGDDLKVRCFLPKFHSIIVFCSGPKPSLLS